jgi:hypothetical protein
MHPQLESILDEAENRYLKPEELNLLSQYVNSLPERMEVYCALRDQELTIMQKVADQLQLELPQEKVETLERSIKNALLVLRHCAMSILLNDETFVRDQLLTWLKQQMQVYQNTAIDITLYRLLNQQLRMAIGAKALSYLSPMLSLAESTLLKQPAPNAALNGR